MCRNCVVAVWMPRSAVCGAASYAERVTAARSTLAAVTNVALKTVLKVSRTTREQGPRQPYIAQSRCVCGMTRNHQQFNTAAATLQGPPLPVLDLALATVVWYRCSGAAFGLLP